MMRLRRALTRKRRRKRNDFLLMTRIGRDGGISSIPFVKVLKITCSEII
jgi:hypothetical protein